MVAPRPHRGERIVYQANDSTASIENEPAMFDAIQPIWEAASPYRVPIASVLFICVASAAVLIAREMPKLAEHRMNLDVKRAMLANGMRAEEIERVLNAGNAAHDNDS